MVGGEGHVPGHNIGVTYGEDLETLGEFLVPEADVAILASCQVTLVKGENRWVVTTQSEGRDVMV